MKFVQEHVAPEEWAQLRDAGPALPAPLQTLSGLLRSPQDLICAKLPGEAQAPG